MQNHHIQSLMDAARAALDLADECRESADAFDEAWAIRCVREEQRHRDRAAWYLERVALAEMAVEYV